MLLPLPRPLGLALAAGLTLVALAERVPVEGEAFAGAAARGRALVVGLGASQGLVGQDPPALETQPAPEGPGSNGCLACHVGIEDMHPWQALSCVDCHGGDATAKDKLSAHVAAPEQAGDERVLPQDRDLAWLRFRNPSDLRVMEVTCGTCHADLCSDLFLSLHGTTAGHLSDGFYEMGLSKEKGSLYGVFPVPSHLTDEGEVDRLVQPPAFTTADDEEELASHFPDLIRKECMQCHLWSEGRAVRGRLGFDGDYRGDGCAACHVPYAVNGLSDSADRTANRTEPGHPRRHAMTAAPSTETCVTCHYGDASIGLHFRGLSQLPPGAPGGPEIEGTTESPLNRVFYLDDNELAPPDVHHELGMHCIDCHGVGDVMGDGALHGQMEHAVAISCEACHGDFDERASLVTERGEHLEHMWREGDEVFLRSKVTGKTHRVKQVVDVLDRDHRDHSPEATRAMTGDHAQLECYACHAGWNINFLGFHFYRNEALTQLDLLSGRRTPGRVTTQEKVFTTWKSFYAGFNENGRVAPYMTGFSTMGTVDDAEGKRILDQAMPVTREGRSGMSMVHHQMHTTRPTARACVECHRTSGTWGMGTSNFRLGRQLAFVADRRGIEAVALNRQALTASVPLAKFVLPDVIDLELQCDPLQGHARHLFVTEGGRGVHALDVSDPAHMRRVAFVSTLSPRGMALSGDHLLVADGIGGLRIVEVSKPEDLEQVGHLPLFDAHEVEVRWPHAFVADGVGGLAIVDIREPIAPRLVGAVSWPGGRTEVAAIDLDLLFQYSRPETVAGTIPAPFRSDARHLCAVLARVRGPILIDVTEPTRPVVVFPRSQEGRSSASVEGVSYRGLALRSKVDVATPQGGERTWERDCLYVAVERTLGNGDQRSTVRVLDVSNPARPRPVGDVESGDASEMLAHVSLYNQPFLQPLAFVPGDEGVFLTDLTVSAEPNPVGVLPGLRDTYAVVVEEFPLDAMVSPTGEQLKDVSHPGSRWLYPREIARLLDVPGRVLGTIEADEAAPPIPGATARAFFQRFDKDRSGLLTGEELRRAGPGLDKNEDGRVTLAELAETGAVFSTGEARSDGPASTFESPRTEPDGDLARLFDGVDPLAHDRNNDRRLDRKELARALIVALDLDADGRLDRHELSRHPGRARQIRYGDEGAMEEFGARDLNRGGTISARELRVRDPEWEALDRDGDGFVQLEPDPVASQRGGAVAMPDPEWPRRRPRALPLPPSLTEELLLTLDADGDRLLTRRELRAREDLAEALDLNRDGVVEEGEWTRILNLVQNGGVRLLADGFEARWDLDGSGRVEEDELPEVARIPLARR